VALKLCEEHGGLVRRLVLEDPPGSESTDFKEIAYGVEDGVARAREAPEALEREQLSENPSWSREDAARSVLGMRECDAELVAAMFRSGLHYDLSDLSGSVEVSTLLVLGSEARGSALPEPERTAVAGALHRGTVEVFEAGHGVHRDDFEGYTRLLGRWSSKPF
ncbi:MAG: alpha/beta hydrolase, partial [Rubrobacteraceae bacterium]